MWASITPILTAVLGFLGGNGFSRLWPANRLRAAISADQALLNKLPAGDARHALQHHIDCQVRYLIDVQQSASYDDRLSAWRGAGFITVAFMLLPFVAAGGSTPWASPLQTVLFAGGGVLFTIGICTVVATLTRRGLRRQGRRQRIIQTRGLPT